LANASRRYGGIRLARGGELRTINGATYAVLTPADGGAPIVFAVTHKVSCRCRWVAGSERARVLGGNGHGRPRSQIIKEALDIALDALVDIETRARAVNGASHNKILAEAPRAAE
jgi:hypothetical protein